MSTSPKSAQIKAKVVHEVSEFLVNALYLALVFGSFTQYRRLVLEAYGIEYGNYFFAVIKALVLGKVIMLGDIFRLGRGLESRSLIFPTLYKTVVFTLFCGAFAFLENGLKGLIHGVGFMGGIAEFWAAAPRDLFPNSLVVAVALVPFFAIKELERVLGAAQIRALFFRRSRYEASSERDAV